MNWSKNTKQKKWALLFLGVFLLSCQRTYRAEGVSESKYNNTPITAQVVTIEQSKESIAYVRMTLSFTNRSDKTCVIDEYSLQWSQGKKRIVLNEFSLGANKKKIRTVRLNHKDGDIGKLLNTKKENIAVTLDAKCTID